MNCKKIEILFIDYISGKLDGTHLTEFEEHLLKCEQCRKETEELKTIWESIGKLPEIQPSTDVKNRFYEQLKILKISEAEIHPAHSFRQILFNRRIINTCMRIAAVLLIFFAGAVSGYIYKKADNSTSTEITEMRMELKQLNRLVSLSLLQNSSPSSRLMGIEWIYKLEKVDTTVVDALFTTLEEDPNINVRLAALEALSLTAIQDVLPMRIIRSLEQQDSPLVQNSLIDLILFYQDKRAVDTFKKIIKNKNLDLYIKSKLETGIAVLQ